LGLPGEYGQPAPAHPRQNSGRAGPDA
jgi:hypothetical protein